MLLVTINKRVLNLNTKSGIAHVSRCVSPEHAGLSMAPLQADRYLYEWRIESARYQRYDLVRKAISKFSYAQLTPLCIAEMASYNVLARSAITITGSPPQIFTLPQNPRRLL
jgi:hypothetical protein